MCVYAYVCVYIYIYIYICVHIMKHVTYTTGTGHDSGIRAPFFQMFGFEILNE